MGTYPLAGLKTVHTSSDFSTSGMILSEISHPNLSVVAALAGAGVGAGAAVVETIRGRGDWDCREERMRVRRNSFRYDRCHSVVRGTRERGDYSDLVEGVIDSFRSISWPSYTTLGRLNTLKLENRTILISSLNRNPGLGTKPRTAAHLAPPTLLSTKPRSRTVSFQFGLGGNGLDSY